MAGRFAGVGFRVEGVPTRWGNQLNGNEPPIVVEKQDYLGSPLAGEIN